MSRRRIGITGATGFVGRHLVRRFAERGDAVTAFQRTVAPPPFPAVTVREFRMPDRIAEDDFAGLDVVVHGALVEHGPEARDSDAVNREGARRVLAASRRHGARVVFLSTLSAHIGAVSHYGRNKLELEDVFDLEYDAVLKLGLVLGPGGLFGSMVDLLRNASIVPLPGGGRQPTQVLWIGDLEHAVVEVVERGLTGRYEVAHPDAHTMRDLYVAICAGLGVRRTFVDVPLPLVELGALVLETLRVPFPIRRENVLGLKHLRTWDTAASMRALGVPAPVGLEESVRRLLVSGSDAIPSGSG